MTGAVVPEVVRTQSDGHLLTAWPRVRLGDVLATQDGRATPVDGSAEYALLGARWYAKGLYVKDRKPGSAIKASTLFRVEENDFVYNRLFAWKGSFAVATAEQAGCYVSNEFPCFKVERDRLDPRFLWLYFSQERVWNEALGLSFGATPTSRNRLKETNLLAMTVPLPPLPEQRRIVDKLDQLVAKIEEARGLRAVSRRGLTALQRNYEQTTFSALATLHGTVPLAELIVEAAYGTSTKCSTERHSLSVPILRIPNVASETVDLTLLKYAALASQESQKVALRPGDLLLVRTNGSADLVGRCAVVPDLPEPMGFASYLIRMRFDPARTTPDYMQRALRHLRNAGELFDLARTTAGQYNVSLGRLRSARIPLPPLTAQTETVASIDSLHRRTGSLLDLRRPELDALIPAILDRAFMGPL
jgi:type I restriction enzyme S subunit